jgi:signal transduction histidine kinase
VKSCNVDHPGAIFVRERQQSIYLFLGLGLALAIGAILTIIVFASMRENNNSVARQKTVVEYETQHLLSALSDKLMTMIYWQDAYDKVAVSWDKKWVDYQFGPYLNAININVVAMFDARGQLLFHYAHGLDKPPSQGLLARNSNVGELLAAALKKGVARPPVITKATIDLNGTPYFAAAGLVTPETDAQFPIPTDKKRVVMFLMRASEASYATLSKSFGVSGLRVARDISNAEGYIHVPLNDAAGNVATHVWWQPLRPGTALLKLLIPLSMSVFLALAAVQSLIVRRWQALQGALYGAQAAAEIAVEESRAKSAFLGTISHELRTPLNAIIGFSDILMKKLHGPLWSPKYDDYAKCIHEGGCILLDKVNDLIEIARIEARDTGLERRPTDAQELIGEAVEALHNSIQDKSIAISVVTGSQAVFCLAAPLSLRQVLIRILDNAIKFSPEGGTVEVHEILDVDEVVLEIRDRGIGIAENHLSNLGKPFVQVEGHLARHNAGIGLGLAISKGLMTAMGGQLAVISALGVGTTVILRLPVASVESEQAAA